MHFSIVELKKNKNKKKRNQKKQKEKVKVKGSSWIEINFTQSLLRILIYSKPNRFRQNWVKYFSFIFDLVSFSLHIFHLNGLDWIIFLENDNIRNN